MRVLVLLSTRTIVHKADFSLRELSMGEGLESPPFMPLASSTEQVATVCFVIHENFLCGQSGLVGDYISNVQFNAVPR